MYRSDGQILLEKNLNNLVSNAAMKIVERNFQENPKLGLIVSNVCFIEHKTNDNERMIFNEIIIKEICNEIGIEFKGSKFPVGSMFWYRQSAFRRLIDIDSSNFHPEIGLPDGTAAHAIERLFSEIVKFEDYDVLEI
ncbi:rhamnan synthesis F family protein [Synechococcus lacustris Tous-12m]